MLQNGWPASAIILALMMTLGGCQREARELRLDPPVDAALNDVAVMPNGIGGAPPDVYGALDRTYEQNAYNLAQGKRLWSWFGCKACHGDGLGGAGPSLIDGWWQYGPDAVSIFVSIRDGRPRGMPAFAGKLNTEQIWQLTGYVQVLGSYLASTAAPGRDDAPQTRPAENRAPASTLFDQDPPR